MLNKALSETLNEKLNETLNEKLNAGSTHGAIAVRMPFDRRANAVRLPSECEEHGRGRRYVLARERCGFGVLSTWRHQKIRNRESEFERESSAMLEFAYKERCPAVQRCLVAYRESRHVQRDASPQSLTTESHHRCASRALFANSRSPRVSPHAHRLTFRRLRAQRII